jgi:nucleoside-diphosphate-sugar epimerase
MSRYVIIGAGSIGSATARLLAERGEEVLVVTRSGSGPTGSGIRRVRCDATDAAQLTEVSQGAVALLNCAAPAYHRWVSDWPPLAEAVLDTAERTGAVLATVSNLYGYGPVSAPMTEQMPLLATTRKGRVRARLWSDALARHEAGRVRATEIRASDYIGPRSQSPLGDRVVPRLLAGKPVQVLPSADTAHSWTYVEDVARLLAVVADDERAWGRPWHVPTNAPRTQREAVADLAQVAGVAPVPVREMPGLLLRLLALVNPTVRELPEVAYQLKAPFIIDSSAATEAFGLNPTPWSEVLSATIDHYRSVESSAVRS